jgi:hypothetical protein
VREVLSARQKSCVAVKNLSENVQNSAPQGGSEDGLTGRPTVWGLIILNGTCTRYTERSETPPAFFRQEGGWRCNQEALKDSKRRVDCQPQASKKQSLLLPQTEPRTVYYLISHEKKLPVDGGAFSSLSSRHYFFAASRAANWRGILAPQSINNYFTASPSRHFSKLRRSSAGSRRRSRRWQWKSYAASPAPGKNTVIMFPLLEVSCSFPLFCLVLANSWVL